MPLDRCNGVRHNQFRVVNLCVHTAENGEKTTHIHICGNRVRFPVYEINADSALSLAGALRSCPPPPSSNP